MFPSYICSANQLTGFYMMGTLVVKGLTCGKHQEYKNYIFMIHMIRGNFLLTIATRNMNVPL